MKLTLESLYKDHDDLRRILYLLEQLLIDIYRGSSQDYPLLQRILVYIKDFPEHIHHAADDAMLSVMLNNGVSDSNFHKDINTLLKDHSDIEDLTRDAIEAVEPMLASMHPDITNIGNKLFTLIKRQRSHLLFEEMNVYPHVAEYLDSEDWEKIAALIPDYEDSIFGHEIRKEYELILKAL